MIGARPRTLALALVLATLALPGCTGDEPGEVLAPAGDVASYARDLHPLLEASCATLDCHGDRGRALRLYSEIGLRAEGLSRDAGLSDPELAANVASLLAVDPGAAPARHLALLKPLSKAEGGVAHVGPKLWLNRDDPGYLCLLGWLSGTPAPSACAQALARVALPPK
ncbi:MAG: hypothetical protein IT370_12365 [Deltaproteobacteria bacterium]|nr:hypothetical protein [Deltaproteobacteria bacterium]